ncbi:MAG: toll/interleukin-1 receptor domain-containing protein [Planctomycetota bacterium]
MDGRSSNSPIVFVSYTHDSPQNTKRVLELSDRLREDGINVILDQYLDYPPKNWSQWVGQQIKQADFVLLICTEKYYGHVMGKEQTDTHKTIMWEADLIAKPISWATPWDDKFIPVLFDYGDGQYIPDPMEKVMYYPVHSKQGYEALCRHLIRP